MKNPHAVALGRLGGAKGGPARAKALSARRRSQIAKAAAKARARSLNADERKELARRAAAARWSKRSHITNGADAPLCVRRVLKRYDPALLLWARPDHRYIIVRDILLHGDANAVRWLRRSLHAGKIRALVRSFAGAGCSESERHKLRTALSLTVQDIPVRDHEGERLRGPLD